MKPKLLIAILSLLILAGIVYFFIPQKSPQDLNTYNSEKFGIRFSYNKKYYLETKELGDGNKGHFAIILTEDTEENRLVREGKSLGREGPVAVSFDLYQSPKESSLLLWVKENSASNFKLSDGSYKEITVDGKPAVYYSWDGLYQADNVAVFHQDYVASIAVTYLTPDDQIRKDFETLLSSMKLY